MPEKEDNWFEKHRLRIELIICILVGILGSTLFAHSEALGLALVEHLFMAIAVAGFIALFIEIALQRQFASNVFEAAIGYLLPEELRDELRWIYGFPFLCESHVQTVRLQPIEDTHLIKVRCEVTRTIKNITDTTQKCPMGLGLDEWFYEGHPSSIFSFTYQKEGEGKSDNLAKYIVRENAGVHLGQDKDLTPDVPVSSGKKIKISFEYEETRQENDLSFIHFGLPTKRTSVTVFAPEHLNTIVEFSHRKSDPKVVRVGEHTWQLDANIIAATSNQGEMA